MSLVHVFGSHLGAIGSLSQVHRGSPPFSFALIVFVVSFIGFGRFHLGPFAFIGSLTVYKRYAFLSLKCCIICMFILLSICLYQRFWVPKIL